MSTQELNKLQISNVTNKEKSKFKFIIILKIIFCGLNTDTHIKIYWLIIFLLIFFKNYFVRDSANEKLNLNINEFKFW